MSQINIVGVETRHGFKTLELHEGDIARIPFDVDVLVLSAFAGSYIPSPGTVIQSLLHRHGIDVEAEAEDPALDLRTALGVWISRELTRDVPIRRLMCVELYGSSLELQETLDNVFGGLLLMEAKGIDVTTVALPLLGSGLQMLPAEQVASELIPRARAYLSRSSSTKRLMFVEIDPIKAKVVSDGIDAALGRKRVNLPHAELVSALRQEIQDTMHENPALFTDGEHVRLAWLSLLNQPEVRSVEFGIAARKLVEYYVGQMGATKGHLAARIRQLETQGRIAPWVCAYMHVLRQLGNEAAHENVGVGRVPPIIAPADLTVGLFCTQRLLDAWAELSEVDSEDA